MSLRNLLAALAAVLLLAGCAGYTVGPTNGQEAGSHSVQINPPVNKTLEPRLGVTLDQQLRKQIQQDGTYTLNTRGNGDVVVDTTIVRYTRIGATFQDTDVLTVRDYTIHLFAQVSAYDRVSGRNLVNREFHGRTTVRVGGDEASAERQAMPMLAQDLARNITAALVDGEW